MRLRLDTDGAAIVRGFLSDQEFGRTAEMAGNAFAFLDGGATYNDREAREAGTSALVVFFSAISQCRAALFD